MKPKKGYTAQQIVTELESEARKLAELRDLNAKGMNSAGYEACASQLLFAESFLRRVAQ